MTCPDDCVCGVCLAIELRRAINVLSDRVIRLEGRLDFLTASAKVPTAAEASAAVSGALANVARAGDRVRLDGKGRSR